MGKHDKAHRVTLSDDQLYIRLLEYARKWENRDRVRRDPADVIRFAMKKWLEENEEELPPEGI